jgi:hypothetical protein
MGSAILHCEGGFCGERKIQEVKPLLSIKRENANWQNYINTQTLDKLIIKCHLKTICNIRTEKCKEQLKFIQTLQNYWTTLIIIIPFQQLLTKINSYG